MDEELSYEEQLKQLDIPSSPANNLAVDTLRSRPSIDKYPVDLPPDRSWVRLSFLLLTDDKNNVPLDNQDVINRAYSSAVLKYTDSSIGGNTCINPPPQFTRYADIREKGIRSDSQKVSLGEAVGHIGMGRYYSEAIDDNNQIIHMRFGVPEFNSLTSFLTGFYSSAAASTARAGRYDDNLLNSIARGVGTIVGLAVAPLFIIPMAINLLGTAAKYFLNIPTSKFYNIRPCMHVYWSAVQSIVNQISVNMGITYPAESELMNKVFNDQNIGTAKKELGILSTFLDKDILEPDGTINVYAIANKSKRLQMDFEINLRNIIENSSNTDYDEAIRKALIGNDGKGGVLNTNSLLLKRSKINEVDRFSLESMLYRFINGTPSLAKATDKSIETSARIPEGDGKTEFTAKQQDPGFLNYLISNMADGSDWASFRVDYTGSVTESFSSSASESTLSSKFNSISKTASDLRFNLADGNIDSLGIINSVKDMVTNAVGAAASTLNIDGLFAIAGNAFMEIPKAWDSSTVNLPSANYTMTLNSPYGNPISQLLNIYIPLAMILAAALPKATGKQSYTSPFLCELYDRGRVITRTGLINSLSITRGEGNLGFNNEGRTSSIIVNFSVMDLSNIMAMPVRTEFSLMPFEGLFDSENAFSDYLMALSGLKLSDCIHRIPILIRQWKRIKADTSTFFSGAQFASYFNTLPGVAQLGAVFRGTNKT